MSRVSVLAVAVALATTSLLHAAEVADQRECVQEASPVGVTGAPMAVVLAEMFPASDEASIETEYGVSAPGVLEVVMSRIGPDGKPVMACVDNEQAARHFLQVPAERVATKKAQDQ
jgi:hypothetical protein